jgi:hypothetical protein
MSNGININYYYIKLWSILKINVELHFKGQ